MSEVRTHPQSAAVRDAPVIRFEPSHDWLRACLSQVLDAADCVQVVDRKQVPSFQHYLEIVRISIPDGARPQQIELFVRIYQGQISWSDLSRRDLPEREWAGWQLARRAGLPLPPTLWCGWFDHSAVAIQRRVAGQPLQQECQPGLMRHCAELLARLHRVRLSEADVSSVVDARLPVLLERLTEWAIDSRSELGVKASGLLRQAAVAVEEQPAVFLHGDLHPGNLLVDQGRVTAVIDWEECAYGDPRLDLAMMDTYLRRLDGWFRRRGSRRADLFFDAYRAATGTDPGPLEFWKRLLDVRKLVVADWVKHRARARLACPGTNLASWSRMGHVAAGRVRRWVARQ